ncbi:MAG: hypothetical protein GXO83_02730 [Chlorobi bacterium]|nr:hypothetical protein [Chlorobiota bacterium]
MKTRSILILSGTLIIGIALGMLISVQLRNAQIRKFRSFGSREGFKKVTLHVIQPTPEQQQEIEPVINAFALKNDSLRKAYRKDFISLMKEYRKELYPLLTKEQIDRLENMTRTEHRKYRQNRPGNRHPGSRSHGKQGGNPNNRQPHPGQWP